MRGRTRWTFNWELNFHNTSILLSFSDQDVPSNFTTLQRGSRSVGCPPRESLCSLVIQNEKVFKSGLFGQSMHLRLSCGQTRLECFRQCGPPGSGTAVALRTISTSSSLKTSIAASSYIHKKRLNGDPGLCSSQFQKVANVAGLVTITSLSRALQEVSPTYNWQARPREQSNHLTLTLDHI